jgi:hypothetical protein
MWKVLIAGTISLVPSASLAQAPNRNAGPALPTKILTGLFMLNDGGWLTPRVSADAFMQEQQERRLGIMHSTPGTAQAKPDGPNFDITQALVGSLEYHWTAGQKPELGLHNVPVRLRIKRGHLYLGFSYRP